MQRRTSQERPNDQQTSAASVPANIEMPTYGAARHVRQRSSPKKPQPAQSKPKIEDSFK